jgi:hypothetical protein
MWYTAQYANPTLYSTLDGRRTPLLLRFYCPAVLHAPGQRGRPADDRNCPDPPLQRPDGPQCPPRLPRARPRRPPAPILAPPYAPGHVRCPGARTPPGAAPPQSPDLWHTAQSLDAHLGCRRQLAPGAHQSPGQWRDDPDHLAAEGRALETGHTLADQSRSGRCPKKTQRDRRIRLAQSPRTWGLGWEDAVWWRRLAPPEPQRWSAPKRIMRRKPWRVMASWSALIRLRPSRGGGALSRGVLSGPSPRPVWREAVPAWRHTA